jgi:hypothetical protein
LGRGKNETNMWLATLVRGTEGGGQAIPGPRLAISSALRHPVGRAKLRSIKSSKGSIDAMAR